jgi:uroporphyrinogen decarboxylase
MTSTSPDFAGLRVAAFESRRAGEIAAMIERMGGRPFVSPALREVPAAENPEAVALARRIVAGEVDVAVLMTGVGLRYFLSEVEKQVDRSQLLSALGRLVSVARGPKPAAALKELGITPTVRVEEPNTWRQIVAALDERHPVTGLRVAVLEHGLPTVPLTEALVARGADVTSVNVYRWELPDDLGPLEENIRGVAAGERDVVVFTSSQQVINLLGVAERLGLAEALRQKLATMVVASIGPTTSQTLREQGLLMDIEPEHAKMGQLLVAAAERAAAILKQKRASRPIIVPDATEKVDQAIAHDSLFLKACRREPVERVPIWLMRQAGRYLPEYREIREKTTFLELCKNSDLSAEVMIRTVERLGVDAAIIFSDLLPILEPMGLNLEFAKGEGPVIHNPVRQAADVDRVRELENTAALSFVMETVRKTRAGLPNHIPVIGFAGAPFTLASYAIEGGGSRNYLHTKSLMYQDEGAWHELLGRLARSAARYLNDQIAAGAAAVQIFDSWAGCLGVDDYRRYVLPHTKSLIGGITPGVPVINFATGNPALLPLLAEAGGAVIGIDWRVRLDDAWRTVGYDKAVQGNLDPVVLLTDRETIGRHAGEVLRQAAGRPGHIFNVGHGVLPQTPPENVIALVDYVHEATSV